LKLYYDKQLRRKYTMEILDEMCFRVIDLARETGEFILAEKDKVSSKDVELKGVHNYVTYVDKTAEKMLVDGLSSIFPPAGFIAEEGTSDKKGDSFNWIIDPLDGTTNFIHGLPPFCISIALQRDDEIVLGVIYEPNLDEVFYAWEDSPAFMNYQPIEVSTKNKLDNALIATGFPYYDYSKLQNYMKIFEYCMINTRGVRRLGSAAIDLAYVACGRMDGFYEYGLSPWDVAAGSFIVERAGGKISDFSGGNNYIDGKEIIAFNSNLHPDFLKVFMDNF